MTIFKKEEPFRMMNGEEKHIGPLDREKLNSLLKIEKDKIEEKMKKLKKSNYQQQKEISTEKFYQQYESYSEFDSLVGVFSGFMFKFNKYFIVEYLNTLIHGLLRVEKKYKEKIFDGSMPETNRLKEEKKEEPHH